MSYATARRRGSNSEINKLLPEDRAVHEWYRFVLSFPPHLVRTYLEDFHLTSDHSVLDPFCGTGTVLVECKKLGIPSIGIEANPMAHFASRVKGDWSPDPDGLAQHANTVAELTRTLLNTQGIEDVSLFDGACDEAHDEAHDEARDEAPKASSLRGLPSEQHSLLLAGSMSPLPLHKTLILLDCLDHHSDERYRAHELLALAKALVFTASNLHFGPEVGVGRPKLDAPVLSPWLTGVQGMANDLRLLESRREIPAVVHHADARHMLDVLEPGSVDVVITSPPYPNEKDYTRTTRLESVLLGFIKNKADLRALKQELVRSNTRNVYKADTDDQWIAGHPEIERIAEAIEHRRIELGKTSGFERLYAHVTKLYFGGIARHLAALRTILRPGAQLAYVVGDQASYLQVMIPTGTLLAGIAQSLGYELVRIDLFRTRLATATRVQLREEVVVLRWLGA